MDLKSEFCYEGSISGNKHGEIVFRNVLNKAG